MRLGENPPVLTPTTATGRSTDRKVRHRTESASPTRSTISRRLAASRYRRITTRPTSTIGTRTLSWQANRSTTVELGYSGAMGIHLFMGQEDINPKDSTSLAQLAQNVSTTGTINDPLGRLNPITGKVLTIQNGTLGSPYLGYSSLYLWYDSSGNSIRHAGFCQRGASRGAGLTFNANYTLSKSIDDASSAGGDKNVLTPVNGQVGGQVVFGGSRAHDRSVSTYDQRHVIHGRRSTICRWAAAANSAPTCRSGPIRCGRLGPRRNSSARRRLLSVGSDGEDGGLAEEVALEKCG